MELNHNGGISEVKAMPGGGPAGTTLGLLMFVVLINETANPGQAVSWGVKLTQPLRDRKPLVLTHAKLIDDATIAESIDLDSVLSLQPEQYWTRPVNWRERFELAVPEPLNKTKTEIDRMIDYADAHYMKVNPKKTKVMLFNPKRRGVDFKPYTRLKGSPLEVIGSHKLVGFLLSDTMTWDLNTEYLVNRAYAKMWVLRRIKALGGSKKILKLIYFQHIRSILEFGVVAWNGALTIKQAKKWKEFKK